LNVNTLNKANISPKNILQRKAMSDIPLCTFHLGFTVRVEVKIRQ